MGRLKGGKNKSKIEITLMDNIPVIKKGRGRPKGSVNKSTLKEEALEIKKDVISLVNEKEVKREIRQLRKLKLKCRAGTQERIDLGRQIKELKAKIETISIIEPEKEPLIAEVLSLQEKYKITPTFDDLEINLNKYTAKQLAKHIECIKRKRAIYETN